MLSREQLKWTQKDTEIVDDYNKDLKAEKFEEIDFADVISEIKKR